MKLVGIILSLFLTGVSLGQNLVNNPDFELFFNCPGHLGEITNACGWERPTVGTSDYFNSCSVIPFSVSIPENEFGYQAAYSGKGYAGLYAFYSHYSFYIPPDYKREYITSMLNQPLKPGINYYVEFYISLSESSKYAVYDLGLLFSMNKPERNDDLSINQTPQINHKGNTPLSDKINWQKISGCFIADSAYRYVTIGNFKNGFDTRFIFVNSQTSNLHYSYYYVDQVLVKEMEKPIISSKQTLCDSGLISITNYDHSFNYLWSNNTSSASFYVDSSDQYWVSINDKECKITSDTIDVQVNYSPSFHLGNDTVINSCTDNSLTLAPVNYFESSSIYTWSTGESTPQISINKSGEYTLTITEANGCTAQDQILVKEACKGTLFVPDCFTPNRDGKNDFFKIYGANIKLIHFSVFNRWGMKVFESNDIAFAWDGDDQAEGIYIWSITYLDGSDLSAKSKAKKGIVNLIR